MEGWPEPLSPKLHPDNDYPICLERLHIPNSNEPDEPSFTNDDIETKCDHHFHRSCYMKYVIDSADHEGWTRCFQCRADLLTRGRLWITQVTETGNRAYLDMTDDVEEYFYKLDHPREAAEKSFLGSMAFSNLEKAEQLLSGADPVNVNCAYPGGQ